MDVEFWRCSECYEWFCHPLEIVEVASEAKTIETFAGPKGVASVEHKMFCEKCLAHIRKGTSAVLPSPVRGFWTTDAPVEPDDIEVASQTLKTVNPEMRPEISVCGYQWKWVPGR